MRFCPQCGESYTDTQGADCWVCGVKLVDTKLDRIIELHENCGCDDCEN